MSELTNSHLAALSRIVDDVWPDAAHTASGSELGVAEAIAKRVADDDTIDREMWARNLDLLASESAAEASLVDRLEQADPEFSAELIKLTRRYLFADPSDAGTNQALDTWRYIGHPGVVLSEPRPGGPYAIADLEDEIGAQVDALDTAHAPIREALSDRVPTEVDVVVVGVGAVGAVALEALSAAGLSVLGIEAGPLLPGSEYAPSEGRVAFYADAAWSTKFTDEQPTWRPFDAAPEAPASYGLGRMVNAVGGSLLHYGAWLRRYHPHHFARRSHLASLGIDAEDRMGASYEDWLVTYDDLAPHYDHIERIIGVSGDQSNPYTPRSADPPMPPLRDFAAGAALGDAAAGAGYHPYPIPVGMNSVPYDGRPASSYSPWNNALGSLDRARWSPLDNLIPYSLARPNAEVVTDARVTRVRADGPGGRVTAVDVEHRGDHVTVSCRAVVLAAYTFENVRLMYLSADSRRPDGLGNTSDQLGRHVMPKAGGAVVMGEFADSTWGRAEGPASQAVALDDFMAYDAARRGLTDGLLGVSLQTENQALPIQIANEPLPAGVPSHGREWQEHLRRWDSRVPLTVGTESAPRSASRIEMSRTAPADRLGMARTVLTHSWTDTERDAAARGIDVASDLLVAMGADRAYARVHMGIALTSHDLGGTRMGQNPETSVVSETLEVHDTPGLYAVGGCAFPSSPPLNPTLTILALTDRAMGRLGKQLAH